MKLGQFAVDSQDLFLSVERKARDPHMSIADFLEALAIRIGATALYTLIYTLTIEDFEDAEKWLEGAFAYSDQRIDWLRSLMYRAALEAEKKVGLKFGESHDIGRILQEAPREIIPRFWEVYRNLYPEEAQMLDKAMDSSSKYSNVLRRLQSGELHMKEIENLPFREVLEKYG